MLTEMYGDLLLDSPCSTSPSRRLLLLRLQSQRRSSGRPVELLRPQQPRALIAATRHYLLQTYLHQLLRLLLVARI